MILYKHNFCEEFWLLQKKWDNKMENMWEMQIYSHFWKLNKNTYKSLMGMWDMIKKFSLKYNG